jgi:hypothetical protein
MIRRCHLPLVLGPWVFRIVLRDRKLLEMVDAAGLEPVNRSDAFG